MRRLAHRRAPRQPPAADPARSAALGDDARRGASRGAQALQLVQDNPGITIAQIAEKMGIKQNYLYRVLPGLAEDGLVVKDGPGWRAKEPADAPAAELPASPAVGASE